MSDEAPPRGALGEVGRIRYGHIMENEHLWIEKRNDISPVRLAEVR